MNNEETNSQENDKLKKTNLVKNVILILVFLVIGLFIGFYGTTKYLESKENKTNTNDQEEWPKDVTNKSDFENNIKDLYAIVSGNAIFYTTSGISYENMNGSDKLTYIYNNLMANSIGETMTLEATYYYSPVCNYDFVTDAPEIEFTVSSTCTVIKINGSEFQNVASKLFNDKNIELNLEFYPLDGKKCVYENDYYLCGNINGGSGITGALESKFDILKVTLDKDDTLKIYDKGYLIDKRSNVANPDDGYDNYYLHSSDSVQYYYELKSADNLTFVHKFMKNDSGKYYYVDSSLYKE